MSTLRIGSIALALAACGIARAETLTAVNSVRSHRCARFPASQALRADTKLGDVASRLAAGESFDRAMKNARYRADRSALIRLKGSVTDVEIEQALRATLCGTVNDPSLSEAGSARRGDELWIVLANPFVPPPQLHRDRIATEILQRVNQARARGYRCGSRYFPPTAALRLDAALTQAAQVHATHMARLGFLEHRGRDGSTPAQRMRIAGYKNLAAAAENIAGGAMTAREAIDGWLTSPGHCANLMGDGYRDMGIAFAVNDQSPLGIYWAQDFARAGP